MTQVIVHMAKKRRKKKKNGIRKTMQNTENFIFVIYKWMCYSHHKMANIQFMMDIKSV